MSEDNVLISVCEFLPGLDFTISRESFDNAARLAYLNSQMMYVGKLLDGTEYVTCDRSVLVAMECPCIAWITPGAAADNIGSELELMHGGGK